MVINTLMLPGRAEFLRLNYASAAGLIDLGVKALVAGKMFTRLILYFDGLISNCLRRSMAQFFDGLLTQKSVDLTQRLFSLILSHLLKVAELLHLLVLDLQLLQMFMVFRRVSFS